MNIYYYKYNHHLRYKVILGMILLFMICIFALIIKKDRLNSVFKYINNAFYISHYTDQSMNVHYGLYDGISIDKFEIDKFEIDKFNFIKSNKLKCSEGFYELIIKAKYLNSLILKKNILLIISSDQKETYYTKFFRRLRIKQYSYLYKIIPHTKKEIIEKNAIIFTYKIDCNIKNPEIRFIIEQ